MTAPTAPAGTCPACSSPATGRFCANCGSALEGAACAGCAAALSPGARFCHRCGTPAGERPAFAAPAVPRTRGVDNALPWVVASIALLALVALLAGQFFNARGDGSAGTRMGGGPAGPLPTGGPPGGPGSSGAPDISNMTPAERAERLFNRIMVLHERNQSDSVQFFAPMALAAYQMIGPLDADQRYHLGRIGEITGTASLARAQADSILQHSPTHLLGLILAGSAARLAGSATEAQAFDRRLVDAQQAELEKNLPEYQQHENDIVTAIARAGRR